MGDKINDAPIAQSATSLSELRSHTGIVGPTASDVISVANRFIELSVNSEGRFPALTQMKLQKLVFYAHAWFLGNFNRPLFDEDVLAYPWGPVVPRLYRLTAGMGKDEIRQPLESFTVRYNAQDAPSYVRSIPRLEEVADVEVLEAVDEVWKQYRNRTATQLSNATHERGEPWTIVRSNTKGQADDRPIIPNEIIHAVYARKVRELETAES